MQIREAGGLRVASNESKIAALTLAEKFSSYERTQFNPKNIEMQTDLTHEEVWDHSLALAENDLAIKNFGVDLGIEELLFKKELRGPSDSRKSREEATKVYRENPKDEEEKKGGVLSGLTGSSK